MDEFQDCPDCEGLGYQGNPGVYVFTCKSCKGAKRVPAGYPPEWARTAAARQLEHAKAKDGGADDLALALLCLASALVENRQLSREIEDRETSMEAELAEALGLDSGDVSITWDDMLARVREACDSFVVTSSLVQLPDVRLYLGEDTNWTRNRDEAAVFGSMKEAEAALEVRRFQALPTSISGRAVVSVLPRKTAPE